MKVCLIVAAALNRAIGRDNQLLWHLPDDMKHFRRVTMGKPILMGRKTYLSIGKALPGRDNIVMTRDRSFAAADVIVCHSVEEAVTEGKACATKRGVDEIMVIGGAEVYRQTLPLADRVYYTQILTDFEGDAFFPPLDPNTWTLSSQESGEDGSSDPLAHEFLIYDRRDPLVAQ